MIPRSARSARPWLAALATVIALLILMPVGAALAHASQITSDPAGGTSLTASPASTTATFAEAFDTARSSMDLHRPDGSTLATNAPASAAAESMTVSGTGTLVPGTFSVRRVTIAPDDNGIGRGSGDIAVALAVLGVVVLAGPSWFLRRSR